MLLTSEKVLSTSVIQSKTDMAGEAGDVAEYQTSFSPETWVAQK
jgi:hypothetical protein